MTTIVSAEQARAAWILTPRNTEAELEAWKLAYELAEPRAAAERRAAEAAREEA